ncbi:MAG: hypothetical protein BWY72_00999 [Bacteroidetes bacterium ADurb.Bin416]|nr:MAG: hypothetical protein BWY72_00999 [Bacteroidetes bacterium ADurb.Bin416]
MLRANDAVGSVVATVIDAAVLVSPYHAFIGQYPQEATGTARMVAHHFPVVKQASSQTTVVEAVQKFGRHENRGFAHVFLGLPVRTVVHGFHPTQFSLGM